MRLCVEWTRAREPGSFVNALLLLQAYLGEDVVRASRWRGTIVRASRLGSFPRMASRLGSMPRIPVLCALQIVLDGYGRKLLFGQYGEKEMIESSNKWVEARRNAWLRYWCSFGVGTSSRKVRGYSDPRLVQGTVFLPRAVIFPIPFFTLWSFYSSLVI